MIKVTRSVVLLLALAGAVGAAGFHSAAAQDKKVKDKGKDGKAVATATFELYADSAKEFRFRLRDGDGALLATSGKGYKTKAECQKVIEAIRRDAARAKLDDQTK
jgi:uncharacterized protein YegP (UPF0339 family)